MLAQRMMWIAWPAFLVAGVLEILVFAFVDPQDMQWLGQPVELSRQGVYTLSFFVFWAVTAGSSALTVLLSMPHAARPDSTPKQEARGVPISI